MRLGEHYRAFHVPYAGRTVLPRYLLDGFFHPYKSGMSYEDTIAFDNLIYVRKNTCLDIPVGFVTAYAHELQHFVQHGLTPKLWDVNRNLYYSLGAFDPNITPSEIPCEREADITSKRVAEQVCGVDATNQFAERQIRYMESVGAKEQKARWVFFRDVASSTHYDLLQQTLPFIEKYRDTVNFGVDTRQPEWWMEECDS